jgi:ribulose-phosphate 3-epimerase
MHLLAVSILSADFANLREEVQKVEFSGADALHVDVMDGRFVPNITVGIPVVESLRRVTSLPIDVHLMIEEPERFAPSFVEAGADWVSFHYEATSHHHRLLTAIKSLGAKAGVAINPSTPVWVLEELLPFADFVLVMSVNPGFGGQTFIETSLGKIERLKRLMGKVGVDVPIEVDGGVGQANIASLVKAGASILVAGSAVFGEDPERSTAELKKLMEEAWKT